MKNSYVQVFYFKMICSTQTTNAYLNLAILSRQLSCAQFISLDFVQKPSFARDYF